MLTGGRIDGPFYVPTLLSRTKPKMKVVCEEIFGPVVTVMPYRSFEEALELVNDSSFGLQAGVFTNDIGRAFEAHRTLEVGGVIVTTRRRSGQTRCPTAVRRTPGAVVRACGSRWRR